MENIIKYGKIDYLDNAKKLMLLCSRLCLCGKSIKEYKEIPSLSDAIEFYDKKLKSYSKSASHIDYASCKEVINELDVVGRMTTPLNDPSILYNLSVACLALSTIYSLFVVADNPDFPDKELADSAMLLDHTVTSKANEAIGYWMHASEERNRNKWGGGGARKAKKVSNIMQLNELYTLMKPSTPSQERSFRRRAQEILDVTDRTILRYLQERKSGNHDKSPD